MKPLLKYPGGKERELKYVIERLPKFNNYYEPFLGGGAIFFGLDTKSHFSFLNDKSEDLIFFYNSVKHNHILFYQCLEQYSKEWDYLSDIIDNNYNEIKDNLNLITDLINPEYADLVLQAIKDKIKRMNKLQEERGALPEKDIQDNIECAIKQGYYYYIRNIYNQKIRNKTYDEERAAAFYFLREYCYSSMFRFNADGEFNVPYGGISYNRKGLKDKINYLKSGLVKDKFDSTLFSCLDFEDFMNRYPPAEDDFMFLDPPYDSDFSNYDNMEFGASDQQRLADYLINKCKCRWLMIIKSSPLILSLYQDGTETKTGSVIKTTGYDKKYSVSFMDRNLRDCEHLIITNY